MINQTHIVIDLETMGIGTNAAIVAIGAVRIERGQLADEFYQRVDLDDAIRHGGETDAGTISWWLKQSAEARAEVDGSQPEASLYDALGDLRHFIQSSKTTRLWGNGATFDLRILGEAYDAIHEYRPWDFRLERDLRTILELYPEAKQGGKFEGTKHHALHDARHEAKQLCKALRLHAGQAESRTVLTNVDASMSERLQLARNIEGELENNPLIHQVEREEVSHG